MTGQRAKNFAEWLAVFEWKRITKAVSNPKSKKLRVLLQKMGLEFMIWHIWTALDPKWSKILPSFTIWSIWAALKPKRFQCHQNFTFGASGQRLARNWPRYYQSWSCGASGWPWARNDSRWHQNWPFGRAEGALHVHAPKNDGRAEGPLHGLRLKN